MAFTEAQLLRQLQEFPATDRYLLAYSGGLDSTVLLHALARLRDRLPAPVLAVHADHGLQDDAQQWTAHCRRECDSLGIELLEITLNLSPISGESLEAYARTARYAAFEEYLGESQLLLTAHHADDQAETMLLQLLRGAGPAGLAAMPACRSFGRGWLARPLLNFSRQEMEDWALAAGLRWVEDGSNEDHGIDRNYLRHQVVPLLKKRWPGTLKTLSRSARHCANAAELIDELAIEDFRRIRGSTLYRLNIQPLVSLSSARQQNLLRFWVREAGLPLPPADRIRRIQHEVVKAKPGAEPLVAWPGAEVRRTRGQLALMPTLPELLPQWQTRWAGGDQLSLPWGFGSLKILYREGGIPLQQWNQSEVTVMFRRPGLNCTPVGREGSRSFKRLCQDLGIPSWLRDRVPLVFLDGVLAAIGDYCICKPFVAPANEQSVGLVWSRPGYLQ